jgi:hypothetical protein
MLPSFSGLFRRSRYGGVIPDGADAADPEAQTRFRQCERFAVTALAFCLKHVPTFRHGFIEMILEKAVRSSEIAAWTIQVEPDEWADLLLEPGGPDRPIFILEFKIHAFLQDHQNPGKADFLMREGYGAVARKHHAHRPVQYVVIDQRDSLFAWDKSQPSGIKCRHLQWAQIADAWKNLRDEASPWESAIIEDLFESLGKLGIYAFSHMKTDKSKVTTSLVDAAEAGQILTHVAEMIPVQRDRWHLTTQHESTDSWSFGVNVLATSGTRAVLRKAHLNLRDVIQPSSNDLIWFGYQSETGDFPMALSVWFYCGSEKAAKEVKKKLMPLETAACTVQQEKENDTWFNVVVKTNKTNKKCDRDWFLSVFKQLGLNNEK